MLNYLLMEEILKLKSLVDINRLIKNIKIFLNIDSYIPTLLYYTCYSTKELLNSNKDLFKAIYHYNHLYINDEELINNSEMKLNILVTYLNMNKKIDIIFENKKKFFI